MADEPRRPTYMAPQIIQNRLITNNDVCMNSGVMLEGFSQPANVQQNHPPPYYSGPSFNLPQNQLVIGRVGSKIGETKRSIDQMEASFDTKVSQQLNQLQADLDLMVYEHIKKMKLETELQFKRQTRLIVESMREKAIDKIKEQEAMIQGMNQINAALLEKTFRLSMENQAWSNLARENEETVKALRENMVQMMIAHARINLEEVVPGRNGGEDDGCHSFCGSNNVGGDNAEGEDQEVEMLPVVAPVVGGGGSKVVGGGGRSRMSSSCGRMESCVLLLPCRHLCLCQICGDVLPAVCQVCMTDCNGSIRVNLC